MKVVFDLRKSVPENAQRYYEKAKKSRNKIPGIRKAIKDTEEKLEKLSLDEISKPSPRKIKRRDKKWFEKYRWFKSSDGYLVIGGRDATTNDILIKKHTDPQDIVFHANVQGAPFFVVKNQGDEAVPESTFREAAEAAASYCSAWKRGAGAADVYQVEPAQVSNTPPSGEYLPKGAFMIYGKKKWYRNVTLEVAVGYGETEPHVIGGPPSSVQEHSLAYVRVSPGDEKSGLLAKKINRFFRNKGYEDADLNDIQYFIPAGKGRII